MVTKTYKSFRALSQLIALTIILANISIVAVSLYYYYLWESEKEAVSELVVTFYDTGLYILGFNIIFGFLANSVATSGSKRYLNLYARTNLIYLVISSGFVIYLHSFYLNFFGSYVGARIGQSLAFLRYIVGRTGVLKPDAAMLKVKNDMKYILNIFSYTHLYTFMGSMSIIIMMRYAMSITPVKIPIPRIIEQTHLGLNTESLRKKRVIEVAP